MRHTLLAGLIALPVVPLAAQEEISPNDMPIEVRGALFQQAGTEPVKKVTREIVDGRTTYRVELERDNAINPRLRFAETGELLVDQTDTSRRALDPAAPAPGTYGPTPTFEHLPAAVRQTVRQEARGREIADIDRKIHEGRTVYEVAYRSAGPNPKVLVAEDGALVRSEKANEERRTIFRGTEMEDIPRAAREAIQREAAGRPLNDIDIERRTGAIVYEVEIRDPQSGVFQIHVDPDGRILHDSRAGEPPSQP